MATNGAYYKKPGVTATNPSDEAELDVVEVMDMLDWYVRYINRGHIEQASKKAIELMEWHQRKVDEAVREARIDELKNIPYDEDFFSAIKVHPHVEKRIAELTNKEGK